ncbi:MAG: class I mannose-6-phosphate isomerase [Gemmatimonadota bacterium]|nr:class I mannose-6-phosphate isomerase [Gemmatimonadota bacterium]
MPLYPLLLEPIYKEKVWGGRALERFARRLPGAPTAKIGESWELADLDATSASGGGGAAAHTRVRNGPLMERTVGAVVHDFGWLVTGPLDLGATGKFPLLLKYLDARDNLSVQVHPSPEYAAAHPDAALKSEAWYVVEADADAVIYKGVVDGTTREAFEAAVHDGTVVELLVQVPARPGDCHYLPSGTVHALGGGILVAEVQTPSDTTFRVYDWGRTDRELHLEEALECIDFGSTEPSAHGAAGSDVDRVVGDAVLRELVSCEYFSIREWTIPRGGEVVFDSDEMCVLMTIDGEGALTWGETMTALRVRAGDTVLLPAALGRTVLSASDDATVLEVRSFGAPPGGALGRSLPVLGIS